MDSFVHYLSDPNIAYLLLTLGALGVLAEFLHPGTILPGVAGAIGLILAFIGLGQLPVSLGGLALLILAVGLFGFELASGVSGALSVAAFIAFLLGSFTLYSSPAAGAPNLSVSPWLIALVSLVVVGYFALVVRAVQRARHAPVTVGLDALRRHPAQAVTRLNPRGQVQIEGEVWTAELDNQAGLPANPVEAGQPVEVTGVDGVVLKVRGKGEPPPDWEKSGWN